MLGRVAERVDVRTSHAQELARDRVHLAELVVDHDDVQVLVRVRERPRHVVERDCMAALLRARSSSARLSSETSVMTVTVPPASTLRRTTR
jgi:hypothetical protein